MNTILSQPEVCIRFDEKKLHKDVIATLQCFSTGVAGKVQLQASNVLHQFARNAPSLEPFRESGALEELQKCRNGTRSTVGVHWRIAIKR